VLAGSYRTTGHALLQFSGGSSFTGIANSASLNLHGANAFVGARAVTARSAGSEAMPACWNWTVGAQVQINGDFFNSGYSRSSTITPRRSTLAIAGTLVTPALSTLAKSSYLAAPGW